MSKNALFAISSRATPLLTPSNAARGFLHTHTHTKSFNSPRLLTTHYMRCDQRADSLAQSIEQAKKYGLDRQETASTFILTQYLWLFFFGSKITHNHTRCRRRRIALLKENQMDFPRKGLTREYSCAF